jgi:dienelactone hydrolase
LIAGRLPQVAAVDDPLDLRITGLRPGAVANIRLDAIGSGGIEWTSSARYSVPADGVLDTSTVISDEGTYVGLSEDGLLWSMQHQEGRLASYVQLSMRLTARISSDDQDLTLVGARQRVLPGLETAELSTGGLVGHFFFPAGRRELPAVVVMGGMGEPPWHFAAALANHGFAALSLRTFGGGHAGLPRRFTGIPIEYITGAIDWLATRPETDDKVGVLGVSTGAPGALLAVQRSERVACVASLSGPTVVLQGGGIGSGAPWTIAGRAVPAIKRRASVMSFMRQGEATQGALIRSMLKRSRDLGDADLRLERLNVPVLVAAGESDEFMPVEAVMAGLRSREGRRGDVVLKYDGAGHIDRLPGCPAEPRVYQRTRYVRQSIGGTTERNAFAIRDSWTRIIDFFREHVGPAREVARG